MLDTPVFSVSWMEGLMRLEKFTQQDELIDQCKGDLYPAGLISSETQLAP